VKGKLGFLSPEQVREQKPDARSDLFSLGIVIHQMLTGSELFMREREIQTVTAVLQWPGLDISSLPADTPEGLAHILEKMLRPNPQQRYQDYQELLADLKFGARGQSGYWHACTCVFPEGGFWFQHLGQS